MQGKKGTQKLFKVHNSYFTTINAFWDYQLFLTTRKSVILTLWTPLQVKITATSRKLQKHQPPIQVGEVKEVTIQKQEAAKYILTMWRIQSSWFTNCSIFPFRRTRLKLPLTKFSRTFLAPAFSCRSFISYQYTILWTLFVWQSRIREKMIACSDDIILTLEPCGTDYFGSINYSSH